MIEKGTKFKIIFLTKGMTKSNIPYFKINYLDKEKNKLTNTYETIGRITFFVNKIINGDDLNVGDFVVIEEVGRIQFRQPYGGNSVATINIDVKLVNGKPEAPSPASEMGIKDIDEDNLPF